LSIASSKFELLHFDIWGPLSIPSVHNHRYFLIILDDYSRFVWIVLLKSKAEVSQHVKNFITLIENQYHITTRTIRSDNGPEFLLNSFYASKGIFHHKSCVETPQQNGRVERKHQHILNVGRALLYQSKLPASCWSYALLHATFIINRTQLFTINPLISCYMIKSLLLILSKSLAHFVILRHYILIELNSMPKLESLSFWVTLLVSKVLSS
jgi:hypothetical protein